MIYQQSTAVFCMRKNVSPSLGAKPSANARFALCSEPPVKVIDKASASITVNPFGAKGLMAFFAARFAVDPSVYPLFSFSQWRGTAAPCGGGKFSLGDAPDRPLRWQGHATPTAIMNSKP
jgi:hypothetical protein